MRQRIKTVATRPEFWLLGLLAWVLLSAERSLGTPWARTALTEGLRWGAGIGLALALSTFFRHTQVAARVILALVGVLALLGIAGGSHLERGGLVGPYQDHQLYASVLLLLLPLTLAVGLTARTASWRTGALAALAAGTFCLFLSQTRSSWMGLVAAALVFAVLWLAHPTRRRDWRVITASALVLTGAALAVWLLLAPADVRAPLTVRIGTLRMLDTDSSWQERLVVWRGAARLAETHPLNGIGLGRYPGRQWAYTGAGRPLTPSERPSLSEEAHSFYLQTVAETGLVGLGLYGAALAAFMVQGLRRLRQTHHSQWGQRDALIIASLSLVAGQAVDALASPSWQFAEASLFFWAALGMGMAAVNGREPEPAASAFPGLRRAGKLALSGVVAVALAANILPLGLLTPVEAYTHSNSVSFQSVSIVQVSQGCPAGSVCFQLTATYSDGRTRDVTFDNDPNGTPAFFNCSKNGSPCVSSFGSGGTRNQLAVTASEHTKSVVIVGTFDDITYTPPSTYTHTPSFRTKGTLTMTLP